MNDTDKLEKMLNIVLNEILPYTEKEVARGNHVFGGAIIDIETLKTVVVGSNNRMENPLFHGEIDTLNRFFRLTERPNTKDLIFLATHDPCPMCAASIAWAGFRELWVLFDYDDVKTAFDMPIDLLMYKELFGANGLQPDNSFFRKHNIKEILASCDQHKKLEPLLNEIIKRYSSLKVQDFDYPGM